MKKLLILILAALLLLVSLCACGGTTNDPTNEPTNDPTNAPTDGNLQNPTDAPCTHAYEESVTKEPTCVEVGEKTFTCSKCGDSYTEEMAAVDHTWIDANCVVPKTCSVCNATEGDVADHTFQDGVCSGCALEQDFGTVVGSWFLEGITTDGSEYERMFLKLDVDGNAYFSAGYFSHLTYETQEELDFILANGYYEYGDGIWYFYDIYEFNGEYYYSAMYGTTAAGTYKQNGNVITVDLVAYYGAEGSMTLKRVSETVLQVVSIDQEICDNIVSEIIINGEKFTWVELNEEEEYLF